MPTASNGRNWGAWVGRLCRPLSVAVLLLAPVAMADTPSVSQTEAKLRSAATLLQSGAYARARYQLEQARRDPLGVEDAARIDALIARLGPARRYEGYLSFALVPETNPGQRSDHDTIFVGGLPFRLSPAAQAQRALGLHLHAGAAVTPEIGEGLQLRLGASVAARLYEDRALRDITLRGDLGFQGETRGGNAWRATVFMAERSVGGRSFGKAGGMSLAWTQALSPVSRLSLNAEGSRWRFARNPGLDGPRLSLAMGVQHLAAPGLVLRASLAHAQTRARADFERNHVWRAQVGADQVFESGLRLGGTFSLHRLATKGPSPVFGITRQDRQHALGLSLAHNAVRLGDYVPVIELNYTRQRSNSTLHDWTNKGLSLSMMRSF